MFLQVRYDSLTEAVRLLGCFSNTVDIPAATDDLKPSDSLDHFASVFCSCKEDR